MKKNSLKFIIINQVNLSSNNLQDAPGVQKCPYSSAVKLLPHNQQKGVEHHSQNILLHSPFFTHGSRYKGQCLIKNFVSALSRFILSQSVLDSRKLKQGSPK